MKTKVEIPVTGVTSCWKSPSNIALVKYWGKYGTQLPRNTSLSLTLKNAYTITRMVARPSSGESMGPEVTFRFEGQENPDFADRIQRFLNEIDSYFVFLRFASLEIESSNNFPHSAGIASSASAMSALALCLCSIEAKLNGEKEDIAHFRQKASLIARLGSGSACRSLYGGFSVWGKHAGIAGTNDEYAISLPFEFHPSFKGLRDDILIVDPAQKKVSSSLGHNLMNGHPFAEARFKQAQQNVEILAKALHEGDWNSFIRVTENEALSLHAMMMTSSPGFVLMHPSSLIIMEKIAYFRKQTGVNVCFTLDAGPNVHVLYPEAEIQKIKPLIEDLKEHCYNRTAIEDIMGEGPANLNFN